MPSRPKRQNSKRLRTSPKTYQSWQESVQTIKVMGQELLYSLNQAHPEVDLELIRETEQLCDRAERLREQITQLIPESVSTTT